MNLQKFAPKIFAGTAILGAATTTVLAVAETPKAMKCIEESNAVTFKEKLKACWKCYIPAGASYVITVASIISGFSSLMQKNTELALAYGFGQTALRLYSERTPVEVRQEIGKQMMAMHEPTITYTVQQDPAADAKSQQVKYYDYLSDRDFYASEIQIENAIMEFEETVLKDKGYGSLNELYSCFHNENLKPIGYTGDILGWKYINGQGPIPLKSPSFDKNGLPCTVLDYVNPPQDEYDK